MKYINNCCISFDGMCVEELFYWPALTFNSVRVSKSAYLSLAIRQWGDDLSIC